MKNIKKKAFTLIEMLLAISVFSVIIVIIMNIYINMVWLKHNIQAKQNLLESSYFVMERLNVLLKDYTIDYEEYFDRSAIGCNDIDKTFQDFVRNIDPNYGYCKNFTAYGNNNNFLTDTWTFSNYYCSSTVSESNPYSVRRNTFLAQWSGCYISGYQSYWQYKYQFVDMKSDSDYRAWAVNDDDDENLWIWPKAIYDQDNVKELYLISQDGNKRLLLRRKLVSSWDFNGTWGIWDIWSEKLYTIQILKLRWFDAWDHHDFDINTSTGIYDGKRDTRACDYSQGFECKGNQIWNNIYSGYRLPIDENDGRENLFDRSLTITDRNISISPTKDPDSSFSEDTVQINPYFTVSFTSKLYAGIRRSRLKNELETFSLHLKTTFNTRNFYTK